MADPETTHSHVTVAQTSERPLGSQRVVVDIVKTLMKYEVLPLASAPSSDPSHMGRASGCVTHERTPAKSRRLTGLLILSRQHGRAAIPPAIRFEVSVASHYRRRRSEPRGYSGNTRLELKPQPAVSGLRVVKRSGFADRSPLPLFRKPPTRAPQDEAMLAAPAIRRSGKTITIQ